MIIVLAKLKLASHSPLILGYAAVWRLRDFISASTVVLVKARLTVPINDANGHDGTTIAYAEVDSDLSTRYETDTVGANSDERNSKL